MRLDVLIAGGMLAGAVPAVSAAASPSPTAVTVEAAEPAFGPTLEPAELVAAVLERNPGLTAARAAAAAARAETAAAGALEDPTASAMLAPLSIGGGAPLGYELRASQRFPAPGKRPLRREVARADADAAAAQVEAARLELAAGAARLFADYYLVARGMEINAEHLALLHALQQVATARYAAGLAPQQAPIQAEVEAAKMLHHEVTLRAEQRRLTAELNALLHRPAAAPLPPPPSALAVPGDHAGGGAALPPAAERPELRVARAEVAARQAELALARRAVHPDVEVMGGYSSMWDTPEHRWTLGVGVDLPLRRGRIRAEVAAAEARLAAAEAQLAEAADRFAAEAAAAAAGVEEMAHLVVLYRDRVLPAARDQVAAARASFESGGESMLGVIEAERSLRDAEQQSHEAVAGYWRERAALARALGELPVALPAADSDTSPEEERQ